jgi:hypothetical protein
MHCIANVIFVLGKAIHRLGFCWRFVLPFRIAGLIVCMICAMVEGGLVIMGVI